MPTTFSDEDLAVPAGGMTSELCTLIVAKHGAMVMAACRRILRDQGLAEDAAQETFVLLVKKAGRLPQHTSLAGWLYHAACRTALNHQRTAMRRQIRESSPEAAAATLPDEQAQNWAALEPELDKAMLTLPERQRDLVVQCYFENQPQRVAAKALGVSESVASRELGSAIEGLRRFFAGRGVTLGAAVLISLLSANAAKAAVPAAIGATSIMRNATGALVPKAGLMLLPVLSMKLKLILAAALVLASAAVYDITSGNSYLRGADAPPKAASISAKAGTQGKAVASDERERLLAEGKQIWARGRKFDREMVDKFLSGVTSGAERGLLLQMFREAGIMVSEAAFDRLAAALPAGHPNYGEAVTFMRRLMFAWIDEAPREALAWAYSSCVADRDKDLAGISGVLCLGIKAARRDLPAWEAFLEVSPDPRIQNLARVWTQEAEQPGLIWAKHKEAGISRESVESYVDLLIETAPPQTALQALLSGPDRKFKNRTIIGLAAKLPADVLAGLARREFAEAGDVSNFLLAMAGGANAEYERAAKFALESVRPEGYENQYAEWAADSARRVYEQWLKNDPASALNQAASSGENNYLEMFMEQAVRGGQVNEQLLVTWLAGKTDKERDGALAAFYRAQSLGDPKQTLQRIIDSQTIGDQIDASKPVLVAWTKRFPLEAAAWLDGLPVTPDHAELVETIAYAWLDKDAAAADRFAREHGLGLTKNHTSALAFAIRNHSDGETRAILAPYRADPEYNKLVALTAGYKLPSDPEAAFEFIRRHAGSGWQSVMVSEAARFLKNKDSRAEAFAKALPKLDLTGVETERLVSVAQSYAKSLEGHGQLRQAFDWTLKLPASAAANVRAGIIGSSDLSDPKKRSMISNWVQSHLVNAEERAQLQQMLQEKGQAASGGN